MELLKKYSKNIVLVICILLIGVLLTQYCTKKPKDTHQLTYDSIKESQQANIEYYRHLYDSVVSLLNQKEIVNRTLSNDVIAISKKHGLIRKNKPNVDTIIKTHEVYIGKECLEKMPVLEARINLLSSINEDLKNLVSLKDEEIKKTQSLLSESLCLNEDQQKDIKNLNRKAKWLKIGLITESIVLLGTAAFIISK